MGLLDDAIREHLDLKRRRGADPAEVQRAEQEALGPVRRAPGAPAADEPPEPAAQSGTAFDHEQDEHWPPEPGAGEDHWDAASEEEASPPSTASEPSHALVEEPEHDDDAPPPLEFTGGHDDQPYDDESEQSRKPKRFGFLRRGPSEPDDDQFDEPEQELTASERHASDETAEYDVEEALAYEHEHAPEPSEDVLEGTPEFLQDAPEHDRLWFEQRPPRDFDFDG